MKQRMSSGMEMGARAALVAAAFLAAICFSASAMAEGKLYCDSAIKSDIMSQQKQRWGQHEQKIDAYWQQPNSFGDMYCGSEMNSAYDSIISGMGLGGLMNAIGNALSKQLSKVCESTLALEPQSASQVAQNMCQQSSGSSSNASQRSVTDTMSYYLQIIAKYDQAYLDSIYSSKNYSECLLMKMVMQWVAAHPQYFVGN